MKYLSISGDSEPKNPPPQKKGVPLLPEVGRGLRLCENHPNHHFLNVASNLEVYFDGKNCFVLSRLVHKYLQKCSLLFLRVSLVHINTILVQTVDKASEDDVYIIRELTITWYSVLGCRSISLNPPFHHKLIF